MLYHLSYHRRSSNGGRGSIFRSPSTPTSLYFALEYESSRNPPHETHVIRRPSSTRPRRKSVTFVRTAHDHCMRNDSTYSDLYGKLRRQREHKDTVIKMKAELGYHLVAKDKAGVERLYEYICEEIGRLERKVEERKRLLMKY